jgi:hypothetical protein
VLDSRSVSPPLLRGPGNVFSNRTHSTMTTALNLTTLQRKNLHDNLLYDTVVGVVPRDLIG